MVQFWGVIKVQMTYVNNFDVCYAVAHICDGCLNFHIFRVLTPSKDV
jgi:hypothetical protein